MTEKDRNTTMPRRRALQIVGFGAAGSLLAIAGCSKPPPAPTPPPAPAPTPAAPPPAPAAAAAATGAQPTIQCAEGGIDDASKQMRRALQYKAKSDSDKNCVGCVQYVAAPKDGECGGCKLFTGPVNPEGYCLSFAPKTA